MLIARIYGLMWILVVAAAVALYLTSSFSFGMTMILGFTASVLAGAGMLVVYPALMTEDIASERTSSNQKKRKNFSKELLPAVG